MVTLRCPTEGLETTLATEHLLQVFTDLESYLASGKAVWRPDWEATKKARQARVR
jgi:hypothetical protein